MTTTLKEYIRLQRGQPADIAAFLGLRLQGLLSNIWSSYTKLSSEFM